MGTRAVIFAAQQRFGPGPERPAPGGPPKGTWIDPHTGSPRRLGRSRPAHLDLEANPRKQALIDAGIMQRVLGRALTLLDDSANPRKYLEVEIKLPVADLAALRRRLAAAGAVRLGRTHEDDTLYDTPGGRLGRAGQLLRLRRRGRRGLLTYKGRARKGGAYKVREESEMPIALPARLAAVLKALGLRKRFRYEKYRTSYRLPSLRGLAIELDETPIGVFLELEGSRKAIDRAAKLLGYNPSDYVATSYHALYLKTCRIRGRVPGDMLFPRPKRKR